MSVNRVLELRKRWIGVDLDGTLAVWQPGMGTEIGDPVPEMLKRVRKWLAEGKEVRLFTARAGGREDAKIKAWLNKYGIPMPITNVKDHMMGEFWDDRAIRVERNTGRVMSARNGDTL